MIAHMEVDGEPKRLLDFSLVDGQPASETHFFEDDDLVVIQELYKELEGTEADTNVHQLQRESYNTPSNTPVRARNPRGQRSQTRSLPVHSMRLEDKFTFNKNAAQAKNCVTNGYVVNGLLDAFVRTADEMKRKQTEALAAVSARNH